MHHGLALIWRQIMTWSDVDVVSWRILASRGHSELTHCPLRNVEVILQMYFELTLRIDIAIRV